MSILRLEGLEISMSKPSVWRQAHDAKSSRKACCVSCGTRGTLHTSLTCMVLPLRNVSLCGTSAHLVACRFVADNTTAVPPTCPQAGHLLSSVRTMQLGPSRYPLSKWLKTLRFPRRYLARRCGTPLAFSLAVSVKVICLQRYDKRVFTMELFI